MLNTKKLKTLFAVLHQSAQTFKQFEKQQINGENVSRVEAFHSFPEEQ